MESSPHLRVAWLLPSLARGFYLQPVLREFSNTFPRTVVITGIWPGFVPGCEGSFDVRVMGRTRFIWNRKLATGYQGGIALPPLTAISFLLQFQPKVIFASGFNLWTLLALIFKSWKKWKVIVVYSGSSPTIDMLGKRFRLFVRRFLTRFVDAFITNSRGGKSYLTKILNAKKNTVFAKPFQVPEVGTLHKPDGPVGFHLTDMQNPIFLFIGRILPGKGLQFLLEACSTLLKEGYDRYTLLVVGEGPQRIKLESYIRSRGLQGHVKWAGWVKYGQLGNYFRAADIFVFPTLEDIWGMVLLEAMLFGKPVLCSKYAGAAEMVADGSNGFVFDPYLPEQLAALMKRFVENPSLIKQMGERSKETMAPYNPETSVLFLGKVVRAVL